MHVLFRLLLILSLLLNPSASVEVLSQHISQEEAISKAEIFIKVNGYTTVEADTTKLSYELLDIFVEDVLEKRHNTLQPFAFCILREENAWYVGFLSSKVDITKLSEKKLKSNLPGRAVIVRDDGAVWISKNDPRFRQYTRLK